MKTPEEILHHQTLLDKHLGQEVVHNGKEAVQARSFTLSSVHHPSLWQRVKAFLTGGIAHRMYVL